MNLGDFAGNIYNGNLSLKAAKIKQRNMKDMIRKLDDYNPNSENYKTQKPNTLLNARELYKTRKIIPVAPENDILPLPKQHPSGMDDWEENEMDSSQFLPEKDKSSILLPSFQRKERTKNEELKNIVNEFDKLIIQNSKIIKKYLFKKHFGFKNLKDMQREIYKTKSSDEKKGLVKVSGLVDLENKIENQTENERPYEIEDIVERILYFNE